jgi:preprotein translocase subunit SecE
MDDKTVNNTKEAGKPDRKSDKDKAAQKNFFVSKYAEFKAEFTKIIWPTKETLLKQTVTVICASVIVGVVIAVMDSGFALLFRGFAGLLG